MKVFAYREKREQMEEDARISGRYFWLLILSFLLFFVGIAAILIATLLAAGSSENVGLVIFIGPIPIVIGSGFDLTAVILLSIILCIFGVLVFLIIRRSLGRAES